MKEILDVIVWGGFIFLLFVFLRGMNDTQVQKHKEKLEESQNKQDQEKTDNDNTNKEQ